MTIPDRLREMPPSTLVVRLLVLVLGLALAWYGLMVVLLAFDVSADSVDAISAYRSIYDFFAGLEPGDVTGTVRLAAGLAGLAAFLLLGWLTWRESRRSASGRERVSLPSDAKGAVTAQPRAIERAAEVAALAGPAITEARARLERDALGLEVETRRARDLPETLRESQARVVESLRLHGLPPLPVNVTLTGYHRKTRRELA